jgi:hypothetical protein
MELKKCPYCGKNVLAMSKVCKHCGKSFEAKPVETVKPVQKTKPVEAVKPVQTAKPVEQVKPVQKTKPATSPVPPPPKAAEPIRTAPAQPPIRSAPARSKGKFSPKLIVAALGVVAALVVLVLIVKNVFNDNNGMQLKPLEKLTPADMTMAKINGLYGKVKTVTSDNSVVEYNEAGELSITNWKGTNRYTVTEEGKTRKFTVKYDGNSRLDQISGVTGNCVDCREYIFDNYGRIVNCYYHLYCMTDAITYNYNGADALPSSYDFVLYEDIEKTTSYYEYPTIDEHGNWTERETTVVTYEISWDTGEETFKEKDRDEKPFVEKRTITYYE